MTSTFDLDRIGGTRALRLLLAEVLCAGQDALTLYRNGAGNRAVRKPDRSPVTEADKAVETRLKEFCTRQFPAIVFLGEENGESTGHKKEMRWVVDPIDGTRAFIRGIPTWSVLVGLEYRDEPVLGIAYMPALEEMFVGIRGNGADCNGQPLRVSAIESLDDAVICHGGLSQFTDQGIGSLLTVLATHTYTQRGFADFDGYRNVLLGRADAMIDPGVKSWDICAAAVLIREAGGRLTSLKGVETIHDGSALASNGNIHDALVQLCSATT